MPGPSALVTGITGFVGGQVARRLRPRVAELVGTGLTSPAAEVGGTPVVRLDLTDATAVAALVREVAPQLVVHTAYDQRRSEVVVAGTRHLATAAAAVGARVVMLSTDVVFDGTDGVFGESAVPRPRSSYGAAKARAERVLADLVEDHVVVRTSLVTGAPLFRQERFLHEVMTGRSGAVLFEDEHRSPVDVDDLAEAVVALALSPETGVFHRSGPRVLSRVELGLALAGVLGIDPVRVRSGRRQDAGLPGPSYLGLVTERPTEGWAARDVTEVWREQAVSLRRALLGP